MKENRPLKFMHIFHLSFCSFDWQRLKHCKYVSIIVRGSQVLGSEQSSAVSFYSAPKAVWCRAILKGVFGVEFYAYSRVLGIVLWIWGDRLRLTPCPQIAVAFGPGHPLASPARVFQ